MLEKREYMLADQIFRSATSIGANLAEANDAVSRKDFRLKMYIALKECSETKFWLELLLDIKLIDEGTYKQHYEDCTELYRILSSITKTLDAKEKTE